MSGTMNLLVICRPSDLQIRQNILSVFFYHIPCSWLLENIKYGLNADVMYRAVYYDLLATV